MDTNNKQPGALKQLGLTLARDNHLEQAKVILSEVCRTCPDDVEAWIMLGNVNGQLGHIEDAENCCRWILDVQPDIPAVHCNLGNVYSLQGKLVEAQACYEEALRLDAGYAHVHTNLGNLFKLTGHFDKATEYLQAALRLDPTVAEAHNNLGGIYSDQGRIEDALTCFEEALRLKPELAQAHNNMGKIYTDMGRLDRAQTHFQTALRLDPRFSIAHSNSLYISNYRADIDTQTLFIEHVRWGEMHGKAAAVAPLHDNAPDSGRRLRIGYVSADLRNHPVGYFIEQVISNHDKAEFDVFCYSNHVICDELTSRLRANATGWRTIAAQTDESVARQIREDGIDILIDLAGHTSANRLTMFALKPAPVQATWMGYIATTGLSAMDYIIADRHVVPPGDECFYLEQVLRLPDSYLCFSPPEFSIETSLPPACSSQRITFGCFNNTAKLTADVITAWAGILDAIPDSQLYFKYGGFGDESTRAHYRSLFEKHGISGQRLRFAGRSPRRDLLRSYNEVDIALDPFPYNGGTTTVEALWMGVPVISLRGKRFVSRVGDSILTTAGMADYVADTVAMYVEMAVALASDTARLADLRRRLRGQLLASPLCNGALFTKNLEGAYRRMWQTWCLTQMRRCETQ